MNLILPAVVGACIDGANVPTDGGNAPGARRGLAGAITPGNERDGELEIVRVDALEAEAAALELDCLPTAPTVVGRALDLLLPSQLHATMWLFGRAFSARPAPAGVWGGVVRLPRSAILAVSPTTATFTTSVGGAAPAPVTIAVSNTGIESAITDLAVGTITYGSGASGWLAATLASQVANTTLALQANQTGLTEGVYTATVPVKSSQASNSPRTIAVTLRVNGIPQIALASTSATFNSVAGEPNPPPVTIAITNGGQGTLASLFAGSPTYGPGATNWLSATINPSTAPTALTLTPQLTNVPPGTYTASVPVNAPNAPNSPQTVSVTLTVTAPPPSTLRFRTINSGRGDFTCGITPAGQAYCWGDNRNGQLGDGTTVTKFRPTRVMQPAGVTFAQIAPGGSHTCALTGTGAAYCWGLGNVGQLGSGVIASPYIVNTPRAVGNSVPYVAIVAVAQDRRARLTPAARLIAGDMIR